MHGTLTGELAVNLHIVWPKRGGPMPDRANLPHYCKAIIDGLTDAGVWADDKQIDPTYTQARASTADMAHWPQGCVVVTIGASE